MACYVIADLHLDVTRPELTQALRTFVASLKPQDELYIIGDLFNFFVGLDPEDIAQQANLTLLPKLYYLERFSQRLLLTHGDIFCSNDLKYQAYQRKVNNKLLQWLFRRLPLSRRRAIGAKIRQQSASSVRYQSEIYGVVTQTVAQYCHNVDLLVHGHIHVLGTYHNEVPGLKARYVLGAWGQNLSYFKLDEQGATLYEQPLASWR